MDQLFSILTNLILGMSVLTSILAAIIYPRLNNPNKYFILLVVFGTIIELTSKAWADVGRNNLIFFHINTLVEFTLLTIFFMSIYEKNKRYILKWILPIGILFILFNSLFIQKVDTFNSIALTTVSMYLIGCSLYYFYLIIDHRVAKQQHVFTKYAVFSIFSLHIISLLVLFFGNYLLNTEGIFVNLIWTVRALIIFFIKTFILFQLIKMALGFYDKRNLA